MPINHGLIDVIRPEFVRQYAVMQLDSTELPCICYNFMIQCRAMNCASPNLCYSVKNGDEGMQIRHTVVEYDLEEAAAMLNISPAALKSAVDAGHLQCYYQRGKNDYRFHEASLRVNKELLSQKDYLNSY